PAIIKRTRRALWLTSSSLRSAVQKKLNATSLPRVLPSVLPRVLDTCAAGSVTPSFLARVGSSLGRRGWRRGGFPPGGRGSRRDADGRVRYALRLPEARQMALNDAIILTAFAQLLERAVHIIQNGTRVRMRLGNQHMKGRERDWLLDHAHLVGKPERGDASAPGQLRFDHAIDRRGVEQAEALIDRRRPHQHDLVVAHPAPPMVVELVHRLPGGNAQRGAGDLFIAERLEPRVRLHEQSGDHFIERLGEEEALAAEL